MVTSLFIGSVMFRNFGLNIQWVPEPKLVGRKSILFRSATQSMGNKKTQLNPGKSRDSNVDDSGAVDHNSARSNRERTSGVTGGNNGGSLVGNTFRIGRKAVTTVITLGLLAVVASEGYSIYDTSQTNSESYFVFDWMGGYDNESKVFSVSSPLFVENPGLIPKDANIAVTISMTCGENESISQSDQDYSLGEEVTLEFEADVPEPMANCIEADNEFIIDISGIVWLKAFGFEVVETDLPEMGYECTKDGQEDGDGDSESVDQHYCAIGWAWPKGR